MELFKSLPSGANKADLWRLCKLYVHGGVYSDVDLVPHLSITQVTRVVKSDFITCLAGPNGGACFQAFMYVGTPPGNGLILHFLLSLLQGDKSISGPAWGGINPTINMYNCLTYNIPGTCLRPETQYTTRPIRIPIRVGRSNTQSKGIELHYFPNKLQYKLQILDPPTTQSYRCEIKGTTLITTRTDQDSGWSSKLIAEIILPTSYTVYLLQEHFGDGGTNWVTSWVSFQ